MRVFETVNDFQVWRKKQSGTLALIPTMGAIHAGHLSLIKKAQEVADHVVVYIFVNPLQFGPQEDFATYPRPFEEDVAACDKARANAILSPPESEIYPDGKERCTKVVPPSFLVDILEGQFRPGWFTGVATVLTKFFSIVQPDIAIFGEKDYQQLLVVRRMVQDLDLSVTIFGAPTVRESDGLAMSSRNVYLSKEERAIAPCIHALLQETANNLISCRRQVEIEQVLQGTRKKFKDYKFELQYLEMRDADTLQPIVLNREETVYKVILLVAAKIGNVRLIDNLVINKPAFLKR